jgi:predicted nicotinamide N-methyase
MPTDAFSPRSGAEAIDELRAEFDLITTSLDVGGRLVRIAHPRNADALIDEAEFERDQRLPYWVDIWPSARVLASRVLTVDPVGRRVLELGCGVGLVSTAAAMAGFDVTASDYYPAALRFARANALVNAGVAITTRLADWRRLPRDLGRFEIVVASDVLYEREYAELVASAFDRTLLVRGVGMVADPGRLAAPSFVAECETRGLRVSLEERVPYEDGSIRQTIDVYSLRRW